MIRRNCKKLKHKPLCWAPENSWNVLFLPKSVVSLCLPLTWQVFGSTTPRLMVRSFFSMQIFFPPHPDHTALSWLSSFSSCSLVLCHRSWLWLSWSFAKLKMGQLPFLNDTSLSLCIWITCLLPGNRGEAGSCGGMIWYELKLFPNRLHRVWSCPLLVWGNLSPTIETILCYISYSPTPLCFCSLQ